MSRGRVVTQVCVIILPFFELKERYTDCGKENKWKIYYK